MEVTQKEVMPRMATETARVVLMEFASRGQKRAVFENLSLDE